MNRHSQKIITWSNVAKQIAELSTCRFTQVGCVLMTHDFKVISTGYNGTISGASHCCDVNKEMKREDHAMYADNREIHAEMNAILQATGASHDLKDAKCFTSLQPCYNCLKHLIQIGVRHIYYTEEYWRNDQTEYIKHIEENFPFLSVYYVHRDVQRNNWIIKQYT